MPYSHSPIEPDLLDRYFAKETAIEETQRVEQWFAAHPEDAFRLRVLLAGLANQGGILPPYEHDARVAAVVDLSVRAARRNRLQGEPSTMRYRDTNAPSDMRHVRVGLVPRTVWYGVAASLVLMATAAGMAKYGASAPWVSAPSSTASTMVTYTTENGERTKVTLPDGSTVLLNVASRLEVPTDYREGHRALRLSGEAVFSVQARTDAPFTIDAGGVVTRVLGTQFGVRRYPTDSMTTVAVRSGKVAVQNVVVAANQQATTFQNGMTQVTVASDTRFAFERDLLMFDGVPLARAVSDLNRWYDVDIRLGDPRLASQELWGQFSETTVDGLVTLLEMTFRVRVVRNGKILTLYPGR